MKYKFDLFVDYGLKWFYNNNHLLKKRYKMIPLPFTSRIPAK